MKNFKFIKCKKRILTIIFLLFSLCLLYNFNVNSKAFAMPFYSLRPKEICLRSRFSTNYSQSSPERKSNVELATHSLNGILIDVGGEFSFNLTVGARTEKRGYKSAKIIVNGEFVDGVGGGVCQVSTTLYNAVLLAGLNVTEYHPHSLAVSYVPPSFDAMVNSSFADLKFMNDTDNPILIYANADGEKITVEIFGEHTNIKYVRKSVIADVIQPPQDKIIIDENGDYPELYFDEFKRLRYAKSGIKSQGYLLAFENGKLIETKKIRSDTYKCIQGVLIQGAKPREVPHESQISTTINKKNL